MTPDRRAYWKLRRADKDDDAIELLKEIETLEQSLGEKSREAELPFNRCQDQAEYTGELAESKRKLLSEIASLEERNRRQLFTGGSFTLHSGEVSDFKIDCDALTDADIAVLAGQLAKRLPVFGSVIGIPRGGLRLSDALRKYASTGPQLIVDDVLTTGASMEKAKRENALPSAIGAVLFARGRCPDWITPLFALTNSAELEEQTVFLEKEQKRIQAQEKRIVELENAVSARGALIDMEQRKVAARDTELERLRTALESVLHGMRSARDPYFMVQLAEEALKEKNDVD